MKAVVVIAAAGAALIGLLWLLVLAPLAARSRITGEARQAVAATFRDPRSADFRRVRVQGAVVCGEVNAANGFGTFMGYQPYMWTQANGPDLRPSFPIAATTTDMRAAQARTLSDWDAAWRACQGQGK